MAYPDTLFGEIQTNNMATTQKTRKKVEPLRVKMLNAKGQIIEGIILAGKIPDEDPGLAIARELGKHKHIEPTPIP